MVRLYIIRHADPDYDTDRENGGSLTDHGRLEAMALGKFLKEQKLTHAYSSPMGRARLTAELALRDELPEILADLKVENWTKELSSWRQVSSIAGNEPASALVSADDRVGEGNTTVTTKKKSRAVWDIPASVIRSQLNECISGEYKGSSPKGWQQRCLDHSQYKDSFDSLCKESDLFLARHGIIREGQRYSMDTSKYDTKSRREMRIAVFCHGGFGLTWLSHLLGIPLPLFHSSFYLPPSSVSTVVFDEHNNYPDIHSMAAFDNNYDPVSHYSQPKRNDFVWMTPRSLCVGGTNHLSMAGLETKVSSYEANNTPSGLKTNFW
mmetsp:Transcript_2081/g.2790  ORF Transcript_2081/g.2790 Transcript_2081/m.2790 type:complete len:322 (-) Transcript_2081:214-1179(-)|eukprot:CAMPEP_0116063968 /NCGR_PEP_ID=MMETSP0322-20121206/8786_1 /TAXON_ID=163516 /ORGANISM="Leptocylindrus danicus var. apora, Strain B651" /LENGTH=321 /DNA_ID=CAMNT_0003549799 /DNA_START=90 /DNA_END=1055 /DNA_ORIENTATION=-